MPLILPGNVASATAAVGYNVANSCRFNAADSANMTITPGSAGSQVKWTLSLWVKRGKLSGGHEYITTATEGSNEFIMEFDGSDRIDWYQYNGSGFDARLLTYRVFRDCSAWYHLVFVWDSSNATAGNRMRIYVNGVEETSFSVDSNTDGASSTWNDDTVHHLGTYTDTAGYFDGYMAEVIFINNAALAPTSFGEFNEDSPNIWQPIEAVEDLTPGTNGFYLDFKASDNLGNNAFASGAADLTEDNLDATDQATDSPTNNFCTLNPRFHTNWQSQVTNTVGFAQGNCTLLENAHSAGMGTMGTTNMKFYYEVKLSASDFSTGVMATNPTASVTASIYSYNDATAYGFYPEDSAQYRFTAGSWTSDSTFSGSGTYHYAVDPTNNKLWVGKDGTWDGDPAAGTGEIITLGTHEYTPWGHCSGTGGTNIGEFNFGGCSAFTVASANSDGNGYGNFEFAVPSGFLALCSKNLGENG